MHVCIMMLTPGGPLAAASTTIISRIDERPVMVQRSPWTIAGHAVRSNAVVLNSGLTINSTSGESCNSGKGCACAQCWLDTGDGAKPRYQSCDACTHQPPSMMMSTVFQCRPRPLASRQNRARVGPRCAWFDPGPVHNHHNSIAFSSRPLQAKSMHVTPLYTEGLWSHAVLIAPR